MYLCRCLDYRCCLSSNMCVCVLLSWSLYIVVCHVCPIQCVCRCLDDRYCLSSNMCVCCCHGHWISLCPIQCICRCLDYRYYLSSDVCVSIVAVVVVMPTVYRCVPPTRCICRCLDDRCCLVMCVLCCVYIVVVMAIVYGYKCVCAAVPCITCQTNQYPCHGPVSQPTPSLLGSIDSIFLCILSSLLSSL